MERELEIGYIVVYIDAQRQSHNALVTKVWSGFAGKPGCNVVYVTSDETKVDPYGAQLDRATSIVHKSTQPAGANCWNFSGES